MTDNRITRVMDNQKNNIGKSNNPDIRSSGHLPKHIAIIMDGNGRWAGRRGLPRAVGHHQGTEAARRIVKLAGDKGIPYLTLFGFSSENWSRPDDEIKELMKLLRHYLRSETAELHKNGARLKVIGDRSAFDDDIADLINNAESLTKKNDKITVIIALNYGGRDDILRAAYTARHENFQSFKDGFYRNLSTRDIPDPDLLIRTSGEMRISNFLLWECAYAELHFTDTLWPDFGEKDLDHALQDYSERERRFGNINVNKATQSQ